MGCRSIPTDPCPLLGVIGDIELERAVIIEIGENGAARARAALHRDIGDCFESAITGIKEELVSRPVRPPAFIHRQGIKTGE